MQIAAWTQILRKQNPGEGFAFLPYSWAFNSRERGGGGDEVWVEGPE